MGKRKPTTPPHAGPQVARRKPQSATLPRPTDTVVLAGALAVVAVSPFFRGLFFPLEQLAALIVVGALLAYYLLTQRGPTVSVRLEPLDIAALLLILAYTLSLTVAANLRNAIQELLKLLLYFGVYWIISRLATDRRRVGLVLHAVLLAGVATALLGLGVAAGVLSYRGAFEGGRIASSFQYANTNAAYLGTVLIITLSLWQVSRRSWWRSLYAAAGYTLLVTFVFTYSRGAWLVLPMAVVGFLLALPAGHRSSSVVRILIVGGAAAAVVGPMTKTLQAPTAISVFKVYGLGLAVAVVLNLVYDYFPAKSVTQSKWRNALAWTFALVVTVSGVGVIAGHVPSTVMERLKSINLQEYDVQARLTFYKDAWKIVKAHPIFGVGGGGWAALYQIYQSYAYHSTQVHNYFLQTLIEAGPLGLVSSLALWGTALWSGFKTRMTAQPEEMVLLVGTIVAATELGLHSIIDFNLTLGAVSLLLWTLFGVARTFQGDRYARARGGSRKHLTLPLHGEIPKMVAVSAMALIFLAAGSLLTGDAYGQAAAKTMNAGEAILAEKYFRKAISFDPITASYYVDLGQIMEARARQTSNQTLLAEAGSLYQTGIRLDPYSPTLHPIYAQFLLRTGKIDTAIAELQKAITLQPYSAWQYENLAKAYVAIGRYFIRLKQKAEAEQYLNRVPVVAEKMKAQNSRAPAFVRPDDRIPADTPSMDLYVGMSYSLRKQWTAAEKKLADAWQGGKNPEAGIWLAVLYEVNGQKAKAEQYRTTALKAQPALQSEYVEALAALR